VNRVDFRYAVVKRLRSIAVLSLKYEDVMSGRKRITM